MARYNYVVKTKKGKVGQGSIEAPSQDVVKQVLEKRGYLVVSVKDVSSRLSFNIPFLGGVSLRDKAVFVRQLATMLDAGISMVESFEVIITQTKNQRLAKVLTDIKEKVEGGMSLSKSFKDYPTIFRPVFVAVVSSGEETGKLPKVLLQLAKELEQEQDFSSKLWAALVYPIFVLSVLIIVVGIMMVFVIPQLTDIFAESGMSLPWTTQMLLAVSNFVARFWWLIILLLTGLGVALRYYLNTEPGRYFWSRFRLKVPIFRALVEEAAMVRFSRMMSLLLGTGVSILRAIKLTATSLDNILYRDVLTKAAAEVEKGVPLSTPLEKSGIFPVVVPQMIKVGEQSGQVSEILGKLARYYQQESESRIKAVSSLVEPVVLVILGLGVGFVVFSIIIPIYQISLGVL